jgi:hypothetical protein
MNLLFRGYHIYCQQMQQLNKVIYVSYKIIAILLHFIEFLNQKYRKLLMHNVNLLDNWVLMLEIFIDLQYPIAANDMFYYHAQYFLLKNLYQL